MSPEIHWVKEAKVPGWPTLNVRCWTFRLLMFSSFLSFGQALQLQSKGLNSSPHPLYLEWSVERGKDASWRWLPFPALGAHICMPTSPQAALASFFTCGRAWLRDLGAVPALAGQREQVNTQEVVSVKNSRGRKTKTFLRWKFLVFWGIQSRHQYYIWNKWTTGLEK